MLCHDKNPLERSHASPLGAVAGGKASAAKRVKRSLNEILFGDLCSQHFSNVRFNERSFNGWDADVILDDQQIAVSWNGEWHYEKITQKHSLLQVQTRDTIKEKEILAAGYTHYVIKDMGSHNPDFVKQEFEKFIQWVRHK